jgi:hypothetical protein
MKPACGASAAQSTSEAALPDWPRRIGAAWIFVDKNCWKTMWVRLEKLVPAAARSYS